MSLIAFIRLRMLIHSAVLQLVFLRDPICSAEAGFAAGADGPMRTLERASERERRSHRTLQLRPATTSNTADPNTTPASNGQVGLVVVSNSTDSG